MTQDLIAKIDKLPKWAIEYINGLNQNIAELTKHVRELSEPESIKDTDTVVHDYHNPDLRLPKGSIIRFDVNGDEVDVSVFDANLAYDVLEIRSNTGMLSVAPRVSNVIEVTVRDR